MSKRNTLMTNSKRQRRAHRARSLIRRGNSRPRLSVHISNLHVSAQIIDDSRQVTLAASTTVGQKLNGTLNQKAGWVGGDIAQKAKKAKIKQVVFDRGGKLYHGRLKALAEAARAAGLEF
mgnify:CR=1 FL=1